MTAVPGTIARVQAPPAVAEADANLAGATERYEAACADVAALRRLEASVREHLDRAEGRARVAGRDLDMARGDAAEARWSAGVVLTASGYARRTP